MADVACCTGGCERHPRPVPGGAGSPGQILHHIPGQPLSAEVMLLLEAAKVQGRAPEWPHGRGTAHINASAVPTPEPGRTARCWTLHRTQHRMSRSAATVPVYSPLSERITSVHHELVAIANNGLQQEGLHWTLQRTAGSAACSASCAPLQYQHCQHTRRTKMSICSGIRHPRRTESCIRSTPADGSGRSQDSAACAPEPLPEVSVSPISSRL